MDQHHCAFDIWFITGQDTQRKVLVYLLQMRVYKLENKN